MFELVIHILINNFTMIMYAYVDKTPGFQINTNKFHIFVDQTILNPLYRKKKTILNPLKFNC